MRILDYPVFRRFWYPTVRIAELATGPKPFTLLGEKVVLWLGPDNAPIAFADKCPHRGVALSVDSKVVDGALRCGYHGWRWGPQGRCVEIPQQPDQTPATNMKSATRFHCVARYGYAWVALEEPLEAIPALPHGDDPAYRQIFEFEWQWRVNMFRVIENALDIAHVSYVHHGTFGTEARPVFPKVEIIDTPSELGFDCAFPVVNPPEQQKNLGIAAGETFRRQRIVTWMPCAFNIHITYPNGRIHSICGFATPIDDTNVRRIQFAFRNDTEADAPAEQVAQFDRTVQAEDIRLLETMDADFPLDPRAEAHMAMDRPNLMYRERLIRLIRAHDPYSAALERELGEPSHRAPRHAA